MTDAFTPERIAQLREILAKATPGLWETDTEKTDGEYGSGPDCHSGYHASIITAGDKRICGTENSSDGEVHEEFDEDGCYAWDEVAARNMKAAATAVNTLPAALDEIERLSASQDRYRQEAITAHDANDGLRVGLSRLKAELDEAMGLLTKIGECQSLGEGNEYRGWSITGLNRAVAAARSFLSRMEGRKDGDIPEAFMKAALTIAATSPTLASDIARALMAADEAATKRERERAAKYHEMQIEELEARLVENTDYSRRSGNPVGAANDFCRTLINNHRLSAEAILKGEA